MKPERRWLVTGTWRRRGRLDAALPEPPADPTSAALISLLEPFSPGVLWIVGGEPTLRADLPELIAAGSARGHTVGLECDGLALVGADAVEHLKAAGLERVRVTLHAGRADAHDWLVGQRGAARRVVRALETLRAAALQLEIAATVTRPTLDHLPELIALARELGVRSVRLSRLDGARVAARERIALTPRFAFVRPALEHAARLAARAGLGLRLVDFPACVQAGAAHVAGPEPWVAIDQPAWREVVASLSPSARVQGCGGCPGDARCGGAPADYVASFGRAELDAGDGFVPAVVEADEIATVRLRFPGPAAMSCSTCADADREPTTPEDTRSLRRRLVRAAQLGAPTLRIASTASLAHPAAAQLLRETTLLSFERVEVAGEASALDAFSDADLYLLKGVARVDAALFGPDPERHDRHTGRAGSFAATLRGLERVARIAGAEVGAYAVVHDGDDLLDYEEAWTSNRLPGEPQLRLSPAGGSLERVARAGATTTHPAMRQALSAVLPACLWDREEVMTTPDPGISFAEGPEPGEPPSHGDVRGIFRACVCGGELQAKCPGLAMGWNSDITPSGEKSQ